MDLDQIKGHYTCLVCQNVYTNPVKITSCGHNFCKNCLDGYISNQNNQQFNSQNICLLCRKPFSKDDIIQDSNLENQMNNEIIKCICGSLMSLSDYVNHSNTCSTSINRMQTDIKKTNIKIREDKIQKNRQTFDCTLCSQKNFDRVGYIDHITKFHPNDRGVCSICKCQPWGDPNYKTHIMGHINIRHRFDYDTVVDYNEDEDDILQRVLLESMNDK